MVNPDPAFWRGKRVLLTGHTGFKGSWLALWLHRLGADVTGLALAPHTKPNLFTEAGIEHTLIHRVADIRNAEAVSAVVGACQPEVVFHLAAQALVRESYRDPVGTWASNVQGTVHVLEAIRHQPGCRVVVAITTDKVYQNHETQYAYVETDALGGHDPYSASKAACEAAIASYRNIFLIANNLILSSARAGNVIGGGDWSAERLLPDAMREWQRHRPLVLRRPDAVRPWQHVLEPLAGYLQLAEQMWQNPRLGDAYNFGPGPDGTASVRQVVSMALQAWPGAQVDWPADTTRMGPMHEAGLLMLNTSKAQRTLGITGRWSLETAVTSTSHWYRRHAAGTSAKALCMADLDAFEATEPCKP